MSQKKRQTGEGIVTTDQGRRIPVRYDLLVQFDNGQPVKSPRAVRGMVTGQDDSSFVFTYFGQDMMLETGHGNTFRFFHVDIDGNVAVTEWIK